MPSGECPTLGHHHLARRGSSGAAGQRVDPSHRTSWTIVSAYAGVKIDTHAASSKKSFALGGSGARVSMAPAGRTRHRAASSNLPPLQLSSRHGGGGCARHLYPLLGAGAYTRSLSAQLELSLCPTGTNLNHERVPSVLKLSSHVNECKPLAWGRRGDYLADAHRGGGRQGGGRRLHSLTSELNLRTFGTHRSR